MSKCPFPPIVTRTFFYILLCISSVSIANPIGHAPWVGDNLNNAPCNGRIEGFGPFDYLSRHTLPQQLNIVEKYHFNSNVEQLIKGQSTTSALADIDYTLRAWPNHHRALYSLVRHRSNEWNTKKLQSKQYTPAECYLQRAIKFSPKDGTSRMLYAMLLHQTGHKEHALEQYMEALKVEPNNTQVKYNLGLLLVELKEYSKANQYAQELYSRGYPLPGLKNKLKDANSWNEASPKPNTSERISNVHEQSD